MDLAENEDARAAFVSKSRSPTTKRMVSCCFVHASQSRLRGEAGLRRIRGVALALTHFFAPALLQAVPRDALKLYSSPQGGGLEG
jgi:hypothetical protein